MKLPRTSDALWQFAQSGWVAFFAFAALDVCGAEEPRSDLRGRTALVEFSGYMHTGNMTRFVLTDPKLLTASGWLLLGQNFSGYTLEDFDADREILSVRRSGELFRLSLKDAKVKSSSPSQSELREKRIIITSDGLLFIAGQISTVGDLRARLEEFAASHSDPKFKLTVYRPVEGDRALIEQTVKSISATIREMPSEWRRRFPFIVLRTTPQK